MAVRPSTWTKNSPTGAGSSRKLPPASVTARSVSSRPSTLTVTPANGSFTEDFADQTKGQNLAQGFIDQGADIIMPVAGPVGLGAAAAAKAAGNTWIIGVDSDWTQTTDYGDIILTSVMKNMGPAVYDVVSEAAVGAGFTNENYVGTLENGGVGLGPSAAAVPAEVVTKLEELSAGIVDGSISVDLG